MPVYSMTGYANATVGAANVADGTPAAGPCVSVEIRSVNGRFLDLALRLPDEQRGLEPALRELVAGSIKRGKLELRLSTSREAETHLPQPTPEQMNRLSRLESTVQGWLPKARALSVNEALAWCRGGAPAVKLDDAALDAARQCLAALREARAREGERLAQMLLERVALLRGLAAQAAPLLPAVVQRHQQRFLERWRDALESAGGGTGIPEQAAQERALNEAAAYAIRIDVAEELSRLGAHCDEVERLLKAGGELGKRLDFLIQELHREANTLGAKSAALELTNLSVDMKVAVEQMREQVQNIE